MKKFYFKIFIFILLTTGFAYGTKLLLENEVLLKSYVKKIIPYDFTNELGKFLLPYREIDKLEKENYFLKKLVEYGVENDIRIKNSLVNIDFLRKSSELSVSGRRIEFDKYSPNKKIIMRGIYNKIPGSAYLEKNKNNIFLLSSTGILGYSNYNSTKLSFKQIKNNINDYIGEEQFLKSQKFAVRDILIFDNKIFVSFTNEIKEDCWNTSLIFSNLNYNNINFKPLFIPDECVSSTDNKDKVFEALQVGGRIVGFENEQILLTTGEFRSRFRAQDKNSTMGKIIKINYKSNNYEIVAMGTRNAQGLYFDQENKLLLSTEHGPEGGDEINLISSENLTNNEVKNLGWAISSYGEHYLKEHYRLPGWRKEVHDPYIKYPLYKSHEKYGFIEPIKYYTPSIGISEIIGIDPKNKIYAHASLVDQSLYLFKLNNENRMIKSIRINIGERIRDIIKYNNKIILFLEETASLGMIDINQIYSLINK